VIKKHTKDKYLKVWTLLFYTGCRISELVSLQVKDLKNILKNKELSLANNTKTNKPRLIYFSDMAVKEISKLFKDDLELDNNVFLIRAWNKLKDKVNSQALTIQCNKYIQSILGDLYSTHSFRQGIITQMATSSINTKVIQEFIGHSNISTTLRYVKPTENDIRKSLVR
jgi:integrase/recombinase XerD